MGDTARSRAASLPAPLVLSKLIDSGCGVGVSDWMSGDYKVMIAGDSGGYRLGRAGEASTELQGSRIVLPDGDQLRVRGFRGRRRVEHEGAVLASVVGSRTRLRLERLWIEAGATTYLLALRDDSRPRLEIFSRKSVVVDILGSMVDMWGSELLTMEKRHEKQRLRFTLFPLGREMQASFRGRATFSRPVPAAAALLALYLTLGPERPVNVGVFCERGPG